MLDFAEVLAKGVVDVLSSAPAELQPEIGVIAFTVRFGEPDPRYQLLEISADVGEPDAERDWRPSTYALSALGVLGDPVSDPEGAAAWRTLQERSERWDLAAGIAPPTGTPDGPLTELELVRMGYVGMLPYIARYVRRRLRRRARWRGTWTMLTVTDFLNDQIYPASALVNDAPLPPGAEAYIIDRSEGDAGL